MKNRQRIEQEFQQQKAETIIALIETGVIDTNLKPIKAPQKPNKTTNYIKQKQK